MQQYRIFGELSVARIELVELSSLLSKSGFEVRVRTSHFDNSIRLIVDFGVFGLLETDSIGADSHLIKGTIFSEGINEVARLSSTFRERDIIHRIEVYDSADKMVEYWHFCWPANSTTHEKGRRQDP